MTDTVEEFAFDDELTEESRDRASTARHSVFSYSP